MKRQNHYNSDELEELLWRAEAVLAEPEEEEPIEEDFDLSEFVPEDLEEEPEVYQNYANSYGSQPQYDSYDYEYEAEDLAPVRPESRYGEFREAKRDMNQRSIHWDNEEEEAIPSPPVKEQPKRKKRRRGCGCGCLTWLIIFVVAIVAAVTLLFRPPQSDDSIGERKRDTATILICGTDEDGTRTDTMMLLYLSGSEKQVSLLSLPRDTYTITSSGNAAKLNSAFGRNGCGEEGMEVLMDYVKDIIGYRPDGYILVDFTLVPQIVDIMGGLDFDVPMDMDVASVAIEAGYQHLTGRQVMTLLRFRKGYATADLGRVQVQRQVLKACMEQWLTPAHLGDAFQAISVLESNSISSLNTSNYLWVAKTLLTGLGNFRNDTLPGVAQYRNDVSYYILDKSQVAELINSSYNPYQVTIRPEALKIAN